MKTLQEEHAMSQLTIGQGKKGDDSTNVSTQNASRLLLDRKQSDEDDGEEIKDESFA